MRTSTGRKIVLLERTPPLSCGDVRGRGAVIVQRGVEPAVRPKAKPDPWAVALATILAMLAFGIICAYLLFLAKESYSHSHAVYYKHVTLSMLGLPQVLGGLMLAALPFIFVYPLMGLVVSSLSGVLAKAIARLYEFGPGERVHPNTFLLFASSWPVTILTIPLLAFAWGIGIVCRFFWK